MTDFKTVGKVGDIEIGEGKAYEFGEQMVAIFLEPDGTYLAIDDLCPHMGASLASGHFAEGIVTCPWHSWSFNARDGAWCDNPRLKIETFKVRIQGDEIQLASVEADGSNESGSALGGASYGGRPNGNGGGKTKACKSCDSLNSDKVVKPTNDRLSNVTSKPEQETDQ